MKKTYTAPTLIESGNLITETRGATPPGMDGGNNQQVLPEGSVGFNL